MKKLLALLTAAVIIASTALTNVFAASTSAEFKLDLESVAVEPAGPGGEPAGTKLEAGAASLTLRTNDGAAVSFASKKAIAAGDNNAAVAAAFSGAEAQMRYDGILYTVSLKLMTLDSGYINKLTAKVYPEGKVPFTLSGASLGPVQQTRAVGDGKLDFTNGTVAVSTVSSGTGGTYDTGNNKTLDIRQVLYCDPSGRAVPLVEKKEDLNGTGDGVRSGTDVYFLVNAPFDNESYFKLRATKGNNSKNIDKIEVKSKYFDKELWQVYGGQQLSGGMTTGRHTFIKVPLKELYTDDEYKITFDLKVSLTSDGEKRYPDYAETSIKADDVTAIWLKNKEVKGDGDYRVGEKGMVIKPLKNDWNEITWYNEARDLAWLQFKADSDVESFYSKLSTKWNHEDYASWFNGQDAYMFDFTGSPKISSTSRADLQIYNPFLDADDHETADPHSITIYQVIDGDLKNVTSDWTYKEGDNGDMAYCTRTRFLGTYIFCEEPVEEAEKDRDGSPSYVPEVTPETTLPNQDNGAKMPANTGKYK